MIDRLIVWYLTLFSVIMQQPGSAPIHAFLGFFKPVLRTRFFQGQRLLSHITIVETTDSCERGMNPVAMTIINPQKESWPSQGSKQGPVLKSAMLWGLVQGEGSLDMIKSYQSKKILTEVSLS